MNARDSYTARESRRLYPKNDSIMPKGVFRSFGAFALLIGVTTITTLAAIGVSIAILVGALPAVWFWLWALVGVLIIAQIVAFLAFVRSGMKAVDNF